MTGNYSWFFSFTKIENGGEVSFRDNSKEKIISIGNVDKDSSIFIENMCLIENLNHNLLSISQLCDKWYRVIFDKIKYVIENACDDKVLFVRKRCINVMHRYRLCINYDKYFFALHDDSWLWNRRLGHVSMNLISKISKKNSLVKTGFQKDRICKAC